jgi:hypothetical protein
MENSPGQLDDQRAPGTGLPGPAQADVPQQAASPPRQTADDFIKQLDTIKSTGGAQGGPMTANDFIKLLNGSTPDTGYDGSLLGGFARSAAQGATANFSDELYGMAGGDKEGVRKLQNDFEREHPWLDTGGKAAGAVASTVGLMLTPGGQPAAAARAAGWGAKGLNAIRSLFGVNNAMKAIPGANAAVNLPGWASRIPGARGLASTVAGTNARRGGLAAAQYGITARAGDYEGEDDPSKGIVPNALDHAGNRLSEGWDLGKLGLDYAGGTALTGLLNRAFGGAANVRDIYDRASTQSGSRMLADAARNDNVGGAELQAIRESVFPTGNVVPRDVAEEVFRAYGQALEGGATQAQADAAARTVLQQWDAGRGLAPTNAANRVRSYFRDTIGE